MLLNHATDAGSTLGQWNTKSVCGYTTVLIAYYVCILCIALPAPLCCTVLNYKVVTKKKEKSLYSGTSCMKVQEVYLQQQSLNLGESHLVPAQCSDTPNLQNYYYYENCKRQSHQVA